MSLEFDHGQLVALAKESRPTKVFFRPLAQGPRPRWRIEVEMERIGTIQLRASRGGERTWSTLDSAYSYAADTLNSAQEFIVCQK
jgi:hypothetical protein